MTVAAPRKTSTKKAAPQKAKTSTKAPKKASSAQKTTSTAPKSPKVVPQAIVKNDQEVKTLRLASNTSQTFLVVSSDFDGNKNRPLQIFVSIILLGVFATTIYMAILTNQIAQTILFYV